MGSSRDLERLKVKTREAEEDFSLARQAFRQQEEALKNLHSKVYIQELPRIMTVRMVPDHGNFLPLSFTLLIPIPRSHSFSANFDVEVATARGTTE